MSTKTIALAAGVPMVVHMAGAYFRLLDAVQPVDVAFRKQNRVTQDDATGVLGGFAITLPDGFDSIELLSATVQTVQIFAGSSRVEYDRAAGTVSVSGNVSVIAAAAASTNLGNTTVGVALQVLFGGANTTRQKLAFMADPSNTVGVCIGGATLSLTNAVIKLAPGESWEIDGFGAGLTWYGISTVAGQVVRCMDVRTT